VAEIEPENEAEVGEAFGLKVGLWLAFGLGKSRAGMERPSVELPSLARLLCSVVIAPELR